MKNIQNYRRVAKKQKRIRSTLNIAVGVSLASFLAVMLCRKMWAKSIAIAIIIFVNYLVPGLIDTIATGFLIVAAFLLKPFIDIVKLIWSKLIIN